eukprot:m.229843 g.229843  ORF g.229843 m.229843 type:complete len:347 (-) comp17056_c10_seq2:648-1688(-)
MGSRRDTHDKDDAYWEARREKRNNLYKVPCDGRVWARSPPPPEHSDDEDLSPLHEDKPLGNGGKDDSETDSSDSSEDERRRRKHKHKSRSKSAHKRKHGKSKKHKHDRHSKDSDDSDDDSDASESEDSYDSDDSRDRKRAKSHHRKHSSKKSSKKHKKKEKKHRHKHRESSDREQDGIPMPLDPNEAEWVEVTATSADGKNHSGSDEDDDAVIGPEAPKTLKLNRRELGDRMLKGEADAIADYVEEGKRIPRRGEIGLTPEEITNYEEQGYIMSGSRNLRMEAVRLRKENEIYDAERQRQMALINQQAREKRDNILLAQFRDYLHKQHKKIVKERDPTLAQVARNE